MMCDCIAQHQQSAGRMEGGSMAPVFNNGSLFLHENHRNIPNSHKDVVIEKKKGMNTKYDTYKHDFCSGKLSIIWTKSMPKWSICHLKRWQRPSL